MDKKNCYVCGKKNLNKNEIGLTKKLLDKNTKKRNGPTHTPDDADEQRGEEPRGRRSKNQKKKRGK
ncbi:hypothetical protein CG709_13615, partial [Lachnotalea glycerini]